MGESGGGSPTGPRLHQVSLRTWRPKDGRRRCVEEAQDEGLRLQPGVRRQLLSADDPVHQPQGHLWTVLKEGRRLPSPQRRSHIGLVHQHAVQRQVLCQAQPGPVPSRCSQNTDQGVEWDHSVSDEHSDAARDAQHGPAPHPHLQAHPRPLHQAGEEPGPPRRSRLAPSSLLTIDGQSEPDEEHSDEQTATSYTPGQCQHSIQPHQTAEGRTSRPGGGQPLHQRALHRQGRKPQARWARCSGQSLPVPQPPIGEGLCQPDPPCLTSTLLVYHMISVVIIMSTTFMRTTTSLIYCLTVSSVFWPDVCYIKISADSNTFVLAPKCSKSYSIE